MNSETPQGATPERNAPQDEGFQTGRIITIAGGHTVHDSYSAFFAPLLPKLQEKLSLSYSRIGSLSFGLQIPFITTLLLGYLADRLSVRYFVIFAPAVTSTLMSLLGLTNGYWPLMAVTVATGLSVAAFHAPAPAMISHISGKRVGLGMSFFMASGELGRTLGPMLVAGGVALFGLEGIWRLMFLGWIATAILFCRLRSVSGTAAGQGSQPSLRSFWKDSRRLMGQLGVMIFFRTFLQVALTGYLPLYMRDVFGADLTEGAFSLTILEAAGVVGAVTAGSLSDRVSRRVILLILFFLSCASVFLFVSVPASLVYWVLPVVGFFSLATTPVFLTILQTRFPRNRSLATGIFMSMGVVFRGLSTWGLGLLADQTDLGTVFRVCILLSLLGVPALLVMPRDELERR